MKYVSKAKTFHPSRGFTVIEMIVVLSVIGWIAMMIMPYLISAKFKADYTACISNEKNLAQALEIIKNQEEGYPKELIRVVHAGHMVKMPVCPSNNLSYEKTYEVDQKGTRFTISCPGIHYRFLDYIKESYPQYSSVDGIDLGKTN